MNYKEFSQALNIKAPLIFGKQKLVMNSAKNKYDYFEEEENINNQNNNNEDMKSLDSFNSSNQTLRLSSAETGVSSIRNSKESINSFGYNQSFFCEKNKNEKNSEENNKNKNDLEMEIKTALKKLSEQYYLNDNKGSLFNYYCSPFINKSIYKRNLYGLNKYKENLSDNDIYKNCPFERCTDK